MESLQPSPQNMSVLANHLDAVLASCGDLLQLPEPLAEPVLLATSVRVLKLSTIMHLLQARHRAKQLGREDPRFASETSDFLAVTVHLPQMAKNFGNSSGDFFSKPGLSDTPRARAEEYQSKAAHFGVQAALAKWAETSELWQTLQKSYLRLAAIERVEACTAHDRHLPSASDDGRARRAPEDKIDHPETPRSCEREIQSSSVGMRIC